MPKLISKCCGAEVTHKESLHDSSPYTVCNECECPCQTLERKEVDSVLPSSTPLSRPETSPDAVWAEDLARKLIFYHHQYPGEGARLIMNTFTQLILVARVAKNMSSQFRSEPLENELSELHQLNKDIV